MADLLQLTEEDLKDIPEFVRNMSVKTDIPGTVDEKDFNARTLGGTLWINYS